MNRLFSFIFFLVAFYGKATAQSQNDTLILPHVITLKDGIYLSFKDLQTNNPLPKENLFVDGDKNQSDFISKTLTDNKEIVFSYKGTKYKAEVAKTWGYCQNGILYINYKGQFARVTLFGSISHFMATVMVTRYVSNFNNGYYGWGGYYGGMGGMYAPSTPVRQPETHEFLLDFNTGNIDECTPTYLETLLSRDIKLYAEYMDLKRKKRNELMILYIRRYNDNHPIVFQPSDEAK